METILKQKQQLMAKLNNNVFNGHEWKEFIDKAIEADCHNIAQNMYHRMKYYERKMNE